DQMPVGLSALGVGLDVVAILEVLVHDLALVRAHRVERGRAAVADGIGRGLLSLAFERLATAVAVAGGVDLDAGGRRAALGSDLEGEVLDRVDRLAVAADEKPEVV